MAIKVLVPLLGEGVEEVTVTKWLKHEGETINELEPLVEVNTDKVDTEIPSPSAGTVLKILAQEGVPAKVGAVLAFIGKPGESLETAERPSASVPGIQQKTAAAPRTAPEVSKPAPKGEIGFVSPLVARIAAESGVNISQVTGTGLGGRVTKNDVLKFIESGPGAAATPQQAVKPAPAVPRRQDDGILIHKAINLGMATSLGEEGLIVPVIKNADSLSLLAMARSVQDLARRARSKKLLPDEVKGGTFTLTNHGTSGSLFAFPVINQPQAGILRVGAMENRVVAIDNAIAIRPMLYLSFAYDHRILDGASADIFLAKVKETLEKWS